MRTMIKEGRWRVKIMCFVMCLSVVMVALLTTSCTTASYGNKFLMSNDIPNQYSFKIYVGGFQLAPPIRQAEKRIEAFMTGKKYSSYEIVNKRYNLIPAYYEFTVRFSE